MYTCLIVDYVIQTARAPSKSELWENKREEKKKPKETKKKREMYTRFVSLYITAQTDRPLRSMTKHQMDCKEGEKNTTSKFVWDMDQRWFKTTENSINVEMRLRRAKHNVTLFCGCLRRRRFSSLFSVLIICIFIYRFCLRFLFSSFAANVFIFDDELDLCVHEAAWSIVSLTHIVASNEINSCYSWQNMTQ